MSFFSDGPFQELNSSGHTRKPKIKSNSWKKSCRTALLNNNVRPIMSEDHPTNSRVYTPWQVSVSCLIGGPAAATWLIAENFRVFNDLRKQKLTFLYGAITLLGLIGLGLVLPKNSSCMVLAALVAGASRDITRRQQGSRIEELRTNGGRIASWWTAVGIGCLCLVATLILIFLVVLLLP
jgi:hypothetical protein